MANDIFPRALRHYRNLAAMSQEALASAAALDRTYVSQLIMARSGVRKLYAGWLCVLSSGGYREFLNRRNGGDLIA